MTFKAYMDVWTLANKGKDVGKEDLAQWVFLAFRRILNQHIICNGFKAIGI
jgi:hypothetical protein